MAANPLLARALGKESSAQVVPGFGIWRARGATQDDGDLVAGRPEEDVMELRGIIFVLWRAGLRIGEALSLSETDLDRARGSLLIRPAAGRPALLRCARANPRTAMCVSRDLRLARSDCCVGECQEAVRAAPPQARTRGRDVT